MSANYTNQLWPEATPDLPCLICGKPDRCRIPPDGRRAFCWGTDSGQVIGVNGNGDGAVYAEIARKTPAQTYPPLGRPLRPLAANSKGDYRGLPLGPGFPRRAI